MISDLSPVLLVTTLVWFAAQATKYLVGLVRERNRKFLDTGGMPSAHAATVVGLATTVGLHDGFEGTLFAFSAVFAAIVMHDALRLRWSVGEQARRLNELSLTAKLVPVVILRGHRIREVVAGAAYGAILSWLLYTTFYP